MPLLNTLATPYADALLQVGESRKQSDALADERLSVGTANR